MTNEPNDASETSWWQFGLIGGIALSLATVYKALRFLQRVAPQFGPWWDFFAVAALVFCLGFVCGCLVWWLHGLSSRGGLLGDALIGAVVANVYFVLLCAVADRDLLRLWTDPVGGPTVVGAATVIGSGGGVLIGLGRQPEQD